MEDMHSYEQTSKAPTQASRLREIFGLIALTFGALLFLSLLTYHPEDPCWNLAGQGATRNAAGPVGAYISDIFLQLFGIGAYFIVFLAFLCAFMMILQRRIAFRWISLVGYACIGLLISSFFHMWWGHWGPHGYSTGGAAGQWLASLLSSQTGRAGTYLLLTMMLALSVVWTTQFSFVETGSRIAERMSPHTRRWALGMHERFLDWRDAWSRWRHARRVRHLGEHKPAFAGAGGDLPELELEHSWLEAEPSWGTDETAALRDRDRALPELTPPGGVDAYRIEMAAVKVSHPDWSSRGATPPPEQEQAPQEGTIRRFASDSEVVEAPAEAPNFAISHLSRGKSLPRLKLDTLALSVPAEEMEAILRNADPEEGYTVDEPYNVPAPEAKRYSDSSDRRTQPPPSCHVMLTSLEELLPVSQGDIESEEHLSEEEIHTLDIDDPRHQQAVAWSHAQAQDAPLNTLIEQQPVSPSEGALAAHVHWPHETLQAQEEQETTLLNEPSETSLGYRATASWDEAELLQANALAQANMQAHYAGGTWQPPAAYPQHEAMAVYAAQYEASSAYPQNAPYAAPYTQPQPEVAQNSGQTADFSVAPTTMEQQPAPSASHFTLGQGVADYSALPVQSAQPTNYHIHAHQPVELDALLEPQAIAVQAVPAATYAEPYFAQESVPTAYPTAPAVSELATDEVSTYSAHQVAPKRAAQTAAPATKPSETSDFLSPSLQHQTADFATQAPTTHVEEAASAQNSSSGTADFSVEAVMQPSIVVEDAQMTRPAKAPTSQEKSPKKLIALYEDDQEDYASEEIGEISLHEEHEEMAVGMEMELVLDHHEAAVSFEDSDDDEDALSLHDEDEENDDDDDISLDEELSEELSLDDEDDDENDVLALLAEPSSSKEEVRSKDPSGRQGLVIHPRLPSNVPSFLPGQAQQQESRAAKEVTPSVYDRAASDIAAVEQAKALENAQQLPLEHVAPSLPKAQDYEEEAPLGLRGVAKQEQPPGIAAATASMNGPLVQAKARAKSDDELKKQSKPSWRLHGYQPPSLDMLDYEEPDRDDDDDLLPEILVENARVLEKTLETFGIKGEVQQILPGPVITMYEYLPAPGIKVSRIAGLADNLAMALSALQVRVLAPIPGKGCVGIELPNKKRETVYIKELLADEKFQETQAKLPMAMGKDTTGTPYIANLAKMPHLLIAGTTGSGKSVGVNSMIVSLLYHASPDDVRFIMIDPKMLELSIYDGIPHLLLPVVIEPKKAATALAWAVNEMERRYSLMAEAGVRNITNYNNLIAQRKKARDMFEQREEALDRARREALSEGDIALDDPADLDWEDSCEYSPDELYQSNAPKSYYEKFPYIVVIIDELADLMMVAAKEVEFSIARLAQMARAAGIHLMLATQRPSVDVLTGVIKANFPSRCAFQVKSKIDSRTILDQPGAERLLGQGDMLLTPPSSSAPVRVHGCYVSEEEIHRIVNHLKKQGEPEYNEEILSSNEPQEEGDDFVDDMYDKAIEVVTKTRNASISALQRKLRVGYNRAARMIEQMERDGIVGEQMGSKPREILAPEGDY